MRIDPFNSLIVLVLASVISDARPKTGGIRKTSQKSGSQVSPNARSKKKVTFKDPFRGQTLYIMLESETVAPEHDEDSKEANKQIAQFLHYLDIWEALNLSKYQKLDSEGPHSNDALNIHIHGRPHPEHDKDELHFTITGPERCGSETSGCQVQFLRELPGSRYTVTSQRPGEVAIILAEKPNWLA
ncbi:MAG: hypothetical protein NXY57DRAFT_960368 [Lentinula lateritia]|nr:MAG: hypothetical protein NXY57DRAFT_960368 [Lentinula lateritia]